MIATHRDLVVCVGCGHEHYRDPRRAFYLRCAWCGSQAFDVYLVDGSRTLLSAPDRTAVLQRRLLASVPRLESHSAALVREFREGGVDRIAGYAPVAGTNQPSMPKLKVRVGRPLSRVVWSKSSGEME